MPSRRARAACLLAVAGLAVGARAQAEAFVLQGAQGDARKVLVPPEGQVSLLFVRSDAASDAALSLYLSEFVSQDDRVASVAFDPATAPARPQRLERKAPASQRELAVPLRVRELIAGETYTGTLSVAGPSGLKHWKLSLRSPRRRSKLVSDSGTVQATCVLAWWKIALAHAGLCESWGCLDGGEFTLTLRDESGVHEIEGITLRRAEQEGNPSGLDLEQNLDFALDGTPVPDLMRWPTGAETEQEKQLRSIPAGGQRSLRVRLRHLAAGEHKARIRIGAANSQDDPAQILELTVQARHHFTAPLAVLLVAILISFGVTKGIANWRRRLQLDQRIGSLRRDWLTQLPPVPPLIWLRATRRQCSAILSQLRLVPAAETLGQRLDCATRMLGVLRTYRQVSGQLDRAHLPRMLHYRASQDLQDILRNIDPDAIDDAAAADAKRRLVDLGATFENPVAHHRDRILAGARRILSEVRLEQLVAAADAADAKKLEQVLEQHWKELCAWLGMGAKRKKPPEQLDIADLEDIAQHASYFEVLWERRTQDADLKALLAELCEYSKEDGDRIDLDWLFRKADLHSWSRLADAAGDVHIEPSNEHRPPDAPVEYRPITFRLVAADDDLARSFLFNAGVRCEWEFELQARPKVRKRLQVWLPLLPSPDTPEPIRWTERAEGNRIVQFVPGAGTLSVTATLSFSGAPRTVQGTLDVESSRDLGLLRRFALSEGVLLAVSAVLAVLSGLSLYYADNLAFGTFEEYVALLTWGIGVDQGKNLIQTFQSLSSAGSAESPPVAADDGEDA